MTTRDWLGARITPLGPGLTFKVVHIIGPSYTRAMRGREMGPLRTGALAGALRREW